MTDTRSLAPWRARPLPVAGSDDHAAAVLGEFGVTVLHGRPGSYVAERLAGVISGWDRWRDCVWLRAGDVSTNTLPEAVAEACARRWEDVDAPSRNEGDPHAGLRDAPSGAVVVLELPRRTPADVVRWIAGARSIARRREISLIAVTEHPCPASWSGLGDVVRAWEVAPPGLDDGLPDAYRRRIVELAGPRAALVRDVIGAMHVWSPEAVVRALDRTAGPRAVLDVLTDELLAVCSVEQRAALRVCVPAGYWHPSLAPHPVGTGELRPWLVPLEDHWGWLRPAWIRSLRRGLGARRDADGVGRRRRETPTPSAPAPVPEPDRASTVLEARLLGPFEVRVDGRAVDRWRGRLGPNLLRLLLSRPRYTCSRDELLAEFWPEAAPHLARNRLQVVVSGLRRDLAEITGAPVLEYGEGRYRIAPHVRVATDTARFEEASAIARAAERDRDTTKAAGAYREMLDLYRGDFAADSPYDQWTLLPRESLRIRYVDALDRLSRIHLDAGEMDDAIAVGQRMVEADMCREDAHRMLMQCYARQGRLHHALRQYDFCVRVLRAQLDVDPEPRTVQLVRSIREDARVSVPRQRSSEDDLGGHAIRLREADRHP